MFCWLLIYIAIAIQPQALTETANIAHLHIRIDLNLYRFGIAVQMVHPSYATPSAF
jgi:hypothetical protein